MALEIFKPPNISARKGSRQDPDRCLRSPSAYNATRLLSRLILMMIAPPRPRYAFATDAPSLKLVLDAEALHWWEDLIYFGGKGLGI